jgi:hypothetical protein
MKQEWTTEIPKCEGWFWFYGDAFTFDINNHCTNELYMVRVRKISNGFAYIANGNFMENEKGWWLETSVPELPIPYSPEINW